MSGDTALSALDTLSQTLNQHRLPQALLVAARLGIADLLAFLHISGKRSLLRFL